RQSRIQVELPELEMEDGARLSPFSVHFPLGQDTVLPSDGTHKVLTCWISFRSSRPVSFFGNMIFTDEEDNRLLQQRRIVFLLYTHTWHFTAPINKL
ncbi:hypothetical protein N310_01892, partial [Acanthisitta chloris]